jgi:hypothetical protein
MRANVTVDHKVGKLFINNRVHDILQDSKRCGPEVTARMPKEYCAIDTSYDTDLIDFIPRPLSPELVLPSQDSEIVWLESFDDHASALI